MQAHGSNPSQSIEKEKKVCQHFHCRSVISHPTFHTLIGVLAGTKLAHHIWCAIPTLFFTVHYCNCKITYGKLQGGPFVNCGFENWFSCAL